MSKSYPPMSKWTPALAMRRTERRVDEVKAALLDIASIWEEIEPGSAADVEAIFEDFGRDMDRLISNLKEWIDEKSAAGEAIGP